MKIERCKLRRCYRGAPEPMTERHVQAIWYDRDLRPERLETCDGVEIRVVHPGTWNLEAGPDFKNAVLEAGPERKRLVGDIEVHMSPAGWDAHGHGEDPAYANVIAHVTWMGGPAPQSLPAGTASIWLGRFMASRPGFSPEQVDITAYPFAKLPADDRPCYRCIGGDSDVAAEVLTAAGEHRMRVKARRLAAILEARRGEREQIFYEEAMNALGYKRNSPGFRHVAEIVPYAAVAGEPENAEAAMLAAGAFVEWDLRGTRPLNSPEARLKAAARLFSTPGAMYLAEVASFSPAAVKSMVKILAGRGLMGRGRAAAVIANVVLPFALAEGRVDSVPQWLPPEDLSMPVRLVAFRMFGRDHNPAVYYSKNGLCVQGLIQIYRDFCLQVHPDCAECELAGDLSESVATAPASVKAAT